MKYLFSLLLLFVSLSVFAQEPPYTPMRLNYQFRGVRVDSLFLIPNYVDTSAANGSLSKRIAGSFIRTGNDFWMRNSDTSAWLQNVNVGSGASPTLNFVNNVFKKSGTDSVFYVVAPADTFFSFKDLGVDTTSLSNRINLKVDSLKRSNDSVYFKRSGVWSFGYKDSLGQPVNFANTNLSATGNRSHNFKNYALSIDSISDFDIKSKNISRFSNLRLLNGNYTLFSYNNSNGNTTSIESLSDSLQVGGYDGALNFYGNVTNLVNGTISLKRGNNRALLPMRNFGTDTIALKSDITGGTDSPDRIDGTATSDVTANMNGDIMRFTNALQWKIDGTGSINIEADSGLLLMSESMKHTTQGNKYEFKDFNNTFLIIDTLGGFQAGDLTKDSLTLILSRQDQNIKFKSKNAMEWTEPDLNLTSKVKTAYTKTAIDLSGGNDTAFVPGTYIIDNASTNTFFLPDATKYAGQTVYMIVKDDAPTGTISALSGTVYQPDESAFPFKSNSFNTFTSDGTDWWGTYTQY